MCKTILIKTDGYGIEHFFYPSYEDAKAVMDSQYTGLIPEDWYEDSEDMSYCGENSAILYHNGEDVYVWQIVVMPESDIPEIHTADEMPTNESIAITRIVNGHECAINLTISELENIFRYRDMEYMKEDAKKHLLEYVDDDEENEELKTEFREKYNVDFDDLINDDNILETLAMDYSDEQDCNVPENNTWDYVIQNYLTKVKNSVVNATFISVWDGGTEIASPCKVNLETKEIFDISKIEPVCDVEILDSEYVRIGEDLYGACSKEEADSTPGYWYWYR